MRLDHVGLTVPDLDAATAFFAEVLGAGVETDTVREPLSGSEIETALGLPVGAVVRRVRMLAVSDGAGIELFEIDTADQAEPAQLSDLGVQHFAVEVADIDDTILRATAAGGRILADPAPIPGGAPGAYGPTAGCRGVGSWN
jgi:catechol 2,3-dioxygenase-like lactoylglutathione lyase family enzyme